MVYTKKQLVKRLNSHYSDKDLILVLLWAKDEFESRFDRDIKNADWEFAVDQCDTESHEQEITEQLEENFMSKTEEM